MSDNTRYIKTRDIVITADKCIIPIYDVIKQTKHGKHMKPLQFKVYLFLGFSPTFSRKRGHISAKNQKIKNLTDRIVEKHILLVSVKFWP